jgi:hypothetical protein
MDYSTTAFSGTEQVLAIQKVGLDYVHALLGKPASRLRSPRSPAHLTPLTQQPFRQMARDEAIGARDQDGA